jgi:hypothetical protein
MLFDQQLLFSDAQSVTATANSTNILDTAGPRDPGAGETLQLVVMVTEAAAAAGSATVEFVLETASDAAFTSPAQLFSSGAVGKAALTLGARTVSASVPPGAQRYLRVAYRVTNGPLTAGKFTAGLALPGLLEESNRMPYGHGLVGAA